jgi:hypothetical protein
MGRIRIEWVAIHQRETQRSPGGAGVEAAGPAVSGGAVEAPAENQGPAASNDEPGYGLIQH